ALTIRSLLFAWTADPLFLVGLQLLDGISAAIVGVLTVLVIADLTHGTGRFNLAQGIIGTASGLGAALSTALFGFVAANFDWAATFLSMASVSLLAISIMWLLMPETRPSTEPKAKSRASTNKSTFRQSLICCPLSPTSGAKADIA